MYAIVGLGNVGGAYNNTYHNIGFKAVDRLAKDLNIKFDTEKCKANFAFGQIGDEEVVLVKPTTYMNLSGNAVDEIMRKFKIKKSNVIVVYDDIDLDAGKFRYRASGSGGTHRGMKNIIEVIGSNEIPRLRIGAGKDARMDLADYVLSKIDPYKIPLIDEAIIEGLKVVKNKIIEGNVLSNDIQIKKQSNWQHK